MEGSWSRKKLNSSSNLVSHQSNNDKIYSYAKDSYEAKYQFLIHKRENKNLKHFNDSKLLLNTWMIRVIFTELLKNTVQIKKTQNIDCFWWYDCWYAW